LTWQVDLPPGSSTWSWLRFDSNTHSSSAKLITDTFADAELTLSENTVAPSYRGAKYPVAREAIRDAQLSVLTEIMGEAMRAHVLMLDGIVATLASSLSDTNGDATTQPTLNSFAIALDAFEALNPPDGPRFCLIHRSVWGILRRDLISTTASLAPSIVTGLAPGGAFAGNVLGVDIWVTDQMPDSGAGKVGVFGVAGDGNSPLGLVFAERPYAEPELADSAARAIQTVVVASRAGAGLTGRPGLGWITADTSA